MTASHEIQATAQVGNLPGMAQTLQSKQEAHQGENRNLTEL